MKKREGAANAGVQRRTLIHAAALSGIARGLVGCATPAPAQKPVRPPSSEPSSNWYDKPAVSLVPPKFKSFDVDIRHRTYDKHREAGCTVVCIRSKRWPGNEFGLWLPEEISRNGKLVWRNWVDPGRFQMNWQFDGSTFSWRKEFADLVVTATLTPDDKNEYLWCEIAFQNRSSAAITDLSASSCFHMVNAPEFISPTGDRLWANLDGHWTPTDQVPRKESPDPRRVCFAKAGLRPRRLIERSAGFPHATMEEEASGPLFIVENLQRTAAVGIATRNFKMLCNNNDYILRCLHSESHPFDTLAPGETRKQESVIIFRAGDHASVSSAFERVLTQRWNKA